MGGRICARNVAHSYFNKYTRETVWALKDVSFEASDGEFLAKGEGAQRHAHPEEQVIYVLRGRLRVTLGEEQYIVEAGQASYHPSNVPHEVLALEDTEALSVKNIVNPQYPATGELR